jgi:hypothetical protein
VVQDERGIRGGLFIDCTQALKFAKFENGGGAPVVIIMAEPFELDMRPVRRNPAERVVAGNPPIAA